MNVVSPASAVPESDGLVLQNVIAGDRGLKPRPAYREHCTGVGAGEVRSIVPYHGADSSKDRLFAATPTAILNCTASSASPATAYTFGSSDTKSGYGIWHGFVTVADHYLYYCDETNGALLYTEATDAWTVPAITGVVPGNLVFAVQWKSRLWFVERNTSKAWYLGVGAIQGAATSFDFGPLFRTGGHLVGLWSWTIDGGAGMDDFLVAISSTGDVVVFAGTDPASATTFQQLGEWNTGGVPAGRRIATQHGGDILVLTLLGILPLSKLVSGQLATPDTYETYKVRPLFNEIITTQQGTRGWEMVIHPQDNFLLLNTPGVPGEPQEQFAMSYATRGWSILRGLDILSAAIWQGFLYFGTRDGRVCKSDGYLDNVSRDGSTANATAVESVVLTRFDPLQSGKKKMLRLVRPHFITHGANPGITAFARYDYNTREVAGGGTGAPVVEGTWDAATWDTTPWSDRFGTYNAVYTPTGIGTAIAIGVRMNTQDYTVLVGFDVAWEEGGLL